MCTFKSTTEFKINILPCKKITAICDTTDSCFFLCLLYCQGNKSISCEQTADTILHLDYEDNMIEYNNIITQHLILETL